MTGSSRQDWVCPICKKPIEENSPQFPFCSDRCKLIDLGRWLDGKYIQRLEPENQSMSEDDNIDL